jgi:poly-gamma-glutamate synthesis protein (capsule biosynthesis protein)
VCVILIICLSPTFILANQSPRISINGQNLDLGNWIVDDQGTSYIPFQVVSNLFGAKSSFDEKNKSVTLLKGDMSLWFQADNKEWVLNQTKLELLNPPRMIYDTLFVPLKVTFEKLGAAVNWDKKTNTIFISSDEMAYQGQSIKELLEQPLPQGFVEIKISAAGDFILGFDEKFGTVNRFDTVFKEKNNDYSYFLKNVKHFFETDDLTIVNLENPLTLATSKTVKEFTFKGKPEYTQILKEGSIEAVNIANNHTYDYLQQGMKDTINHLKKANISYFGDGHKAITEVQGIKVGSLGYKGWSNAKAVKESIKRDLENMKKNTDLIIVSFHWGEERSNYPNSIQKDLGKFAIDQGADLVLGHHPHVIQGIEQYKNKYIVYSLANFCFGGNRNPSDKDTFIFQQSFIVDDKKQIVTSKMNIIPCLVSSVTYRNDYCPTPQTGQTADRIMNRLKLYSKNFVKSADFQK